MKMDFMHIFKLGWPVLSVLILFSVVGLSVFLEAAALLRRATRAAADRDRARVENTLDTLDSRLALLGTIANAAPFVGLLGTVLGIIRAFHSIALNTGGGIAAVAGGISEALVSTAAGLAVAIPASMVYNYFTHHAARAAKAAGLE